MRERILVVEDEATLCANVARALTRAGHVVSAVETGQAALQLLDEHAFDLVITDLRLPDVDGLAVLDRVRAVSPETVTLIMTAYASVDSAVEALRRGAHDYILKPLSLSDLQRKVQHIAEYRRLGQENARLRTLLRGDEDALATLRRGGPLMQEVCDVLEKVATSTSNVLILGESGSGKELAARAIHQCSARAEGPFVTLDTGAIPDALVESYLFGHEAGAFPGADRPREGLFRAATGGTLFLDEIGDMPLALQAKLLRAVETKELLPVGADVAVTVDARILAATHRDLGAMAQDGTFRQDLLFRLQVVQLRMPTLRARAADIPSLVEELVTQHARTLKKRVRAIAPDAMAILAAYAWPGNVRELSNVLERAVILCSDDTVTPIDLPVEIGVEPHARDSSPPSATSAHSGTAIDGEPRLDLATLGFQRGHIAKVLDQTQGNREAAAKRLGLSPATLYRYLQKVGLKGYGVDGDES